MKLKRFLLRSYPPGGILDYELRDKSREMQEIDLFHLHVGAAWDEIFNQIWRRKRRVS